MHPADRFRAAASLPAPVSSFASDNTAGVCPQVMAALSEANTPAALPYEADPWTGALVEAMRDLFAAPVEMVCCWGGTGANVVGLACLLRPWEAVLCPESAHIVVDECGAPAHFSGASVIPVPTLDGKLEPAAIEQYAHWIGFEHHPQPRVVSVSQVTETGIPYTVEELGILCDTAHRHSMRVHVDGARIANAVVSLDTDLRTMLRDTGVDVLTFGATKNGAMYGEAVVFLDPQLGENARFVRKQAGQLPSKSRFVSAQLLALLRDDVWLHNARTANSMAKVLAARVAGIDGVEVERPPAANAMFVRLPRDVIKPLQDWSFFWDWDFERATVRWMTSFVTTDDDVARFARGVEGFLAARG
jgi:threonine aldolase